jgi:hypothetical protein
VGAAFKSEDLEKVSVTLYLRMLDFRIEELMTTLKLPSWTWNHANREFFSRVSENVPSPFALPHAPTRRRTENTRESRTFARPPECRTPTPAWDLMCARPSLPPRSLPSSFFLTPRDHDCSFPPRNGGSPPRDDDEGARDTH